MSYSIAKPDAGPSPKIDVVQIRTNFSQFGSKFSSTSAGVKYNHTALNDPNQGDHEAIIFEKQLADPGVTEDLSVLYCKDAPSNAGTQPQLFVQIPKFLPNDYDTKDAPNNPMQLTYNTVNISGPVYQSFLAGGYLFYFGTISNIAIPITLSPVPTKILAAVATSHQFDSLPNPTPFKVATQILSASQFQINSNATGVYTFTWWAIGSV